MVPGFAPDVNRMESGVILVVAASLARRGMGVTVGTLLSVPVGSASTGGPPDPSPFTAGVRWGQLANGHG